MRLPLLGVALVALLPACRQVAGVDDLGGYPTEPPPGQPCERTADCIELYGEHHVCRPADKRCAPLLSPDCQSVYGDYQADDAIVLGTVFPTTGVDGPAGRPMEYAVDLAISDFEVSGNGLPPIAGSVARRPLVAVHCDDQADVERSKAAARHLVDDVGVPAIIGGAYSGIAIDVATEVTIAAGTLFMSPSATSAAITYLQDDDLVWRVAPSDAIQAKAMVQVIQRDESVVRQELGLTASDKVRVSVVYKGDAYGRGMAEDIAQALVLNGQPALAAANKASFTQFDYGDPNAPSINPPVYAAVVDKVVAAKPHVLVIVGTTELIQKLMVPIEQGWQSPSPRPYYVFSDGPKIQDLALAVVAQDPGAKTQLGHRISGTTPGSTGTDFQAFASHYEAQTNRPDDLIAFGVAGAYDSAYLLAYAMVAHAEQVPTGAGLVQGLGLLVPDPKAPVVHVGPGSINFGFDSLDKSGRIDLEGASGKLDFDLETGEAESEILLWCVNTSGSVPSVPDTGETYDPATGKLVGSVAPGTCD